MSRPDGRAWESAAGVVFADDGRMFVWERTGRVWLLAGAATNAEPLIDLSDEVSTIGSLGLTGFALDPQFTRNGYLYLFYAVDPQHLANCDAPVSGAAVCRSAYRAGQHAASGATFGRLVRYQLARPAGAQDFRAANSVDYASRRILLGETPVGDVPTGCVITDGAHGPGALAFGSDGTLLAGCGDGAGVSGEDPGSDPSTLYRQALAARLMTPAENVGAFRAQLVDSLSGKILRLDAAGGAGVPGNPFYDPRAPRAPRSRVWVLGLHDPQHFTVRPGSGSARVADGRPGTLYIGEVGFSTWESLVVARDGRMNFGWPLYEGVGNDATDYGSLPAVNLLAPNPLFPRLCSQQYFLFRELITADPLRASWPNPCQPSSEIPAEDNVFIRDRPAIDWLHRGADARWAAFDTAGEPLALTLGTRAPNGVLVSGPLFGGMASVGGVWYQGSSFPAAFRNVYYHADSGGGWIKAFAFDANDHAVSVRDFLGAGGPIRALGNDPQTGDLYYISGLLGSEVHRLTYSHTSAAAATAAAAPAGAELAIPSSATPPARAAAQVTPKALSSRGTAALSSAGTGSWSGTDIGAVSLAGSFTQSGGTFTVSGSGADIYSNADGFQFVSQAFTGDGSITARVVSQTNTNAWAKAGVMFRETLTAGSTNALVAVSPTNGIVFQDRPTTGGATGVVTYGPKVAAPYWVRLVRTGNTFSSYTSPDGTTWTSLGQTTITMASQAVVGLAVSSHNNGTLSTAVFDNVTVTASTWNGGDIGAVAHAGTYSFNNGTFTVSGSGADIYSNADAFQFVSQAISGDGSITARVVSQTNTNAWAKAGVMLRETLAAGATNALVAISPANGIVFQDRPTTGGATAVVTYGPKVAAPYWVQLVRTGNTFSSYTSPDGTTWTLLGQTTITMASLAHVGLAVSSHNNGTLSTAVFDNVTVTGSAAPPDTQPPTVPTGLAATVIGPNSVTLSWNASTDNPGGTGVGGYYVYRNGNTATPIATVTSGTSFTDVGLAPATMYSYQVAAFDNANPPNVSVPCSALSVTTQGAGASNWSGSSIGAVAAAGSYSLNSGTFTVMGSGTDIYNNSDAFEFVSEPLIGDGSITARVVSQTNTNAWAKAGVMLRETLTAGSTNALVAVSPANGIVFQDRATTGGASAVVTYGPNVAAPYWVRLVRSGNTFSAYASPDGTTWTSLGHTTISMASQAYVGLSVTSHNNGTLSTAMFDNVTVSGQIPFAVTPRIAAVTPGQSQQFTAAVSGGATWSVDGVGGGNGTVGTITSNGLYAPGSALGTHVIVATSTADPSQSGNATVAVTGLGGVYTYHNDLSRDGVNSQEYALTPVSVNSPGFGKLFSCTVDGAVYAQPLWVAGLNVQGAQHNVVFVATQHDSLYAFDADASPCVQLWGVSLIDTGHGAATVETTVPSGATGNLVGSGLGDITPEVGVTGTPVIDPASGTLYVVSKSMNSAGTTFYQRLHAIDLATGNEKAGSPVTIAATYPGSGDGGSTVSFSARVQNQRPGLALVNGTVYIAWGSHEDSGQWYGWVIGYSYDGSAFTQTAVFNATPNQGRGGIWMGGGAPAADASNNLYVLTGNGIFDATSTTAPNNDYGDSLLKLTSNLTLAQYFTPSDQMTLYQNDGDFASGAAAILADLPAGSPVTHLIMGGGKDQALYVLNRDALGGLGDSAAVQKISFGAPIFTTGAYWNNTFYLAGSGGPLRAYALNASVPTFTLAGSSPTIYGFPGTGPSVSAAGTANGVVWTMSNSHYCTQPTAGCAPTVIHAYDATNVAIELWNSSIVPADAAGNAVKFTIPTVANGKVYIGTRGNNTGGAFGSTTVSGELDVYGLNPN